MIAAWMAYCLLVACLLGGAAAAAERGLRLSRLPGRWAWAAAMAGSLLLPAAAFLVPRVWPAGPSPVAGGGALLPLVVGAAGLPAGADVAAGTALVARLAGLDGALLALWVAGSAGLAGFVALSVLRLRRERRRWRPGRVGGVPVLEGGERGPAVVGMLRGRVVLPTWFPELEGELQRLVLLHEGEHLRAGDHRLFGAAGLVLLLLPWNAALWWQLRRLRLALEVDCDARVLARGIAPAAYGDLLLRVGSRLSGLGPAGAGLSEPKSFLERRVRAMTEKRPRNAVAGAVTAGAVSAFLLVVSCEAPAPPAQEGATVPPAEASAGEQDATPSAIPYDTPPRLENADEVRSALAESYPAALKEEGVGGTVTLWILIDETGAVRNVRVKESSGLAELDAAAGEVARLMRFAPAENAGERTAVWVQQTITFAPERSASAGPEEGGATLHLRGDGEGGATPRLRGEGPVRLRLTPGSLNLAQDGDGPLILVDGAEPVQGTLARLNPEEIERVEVVKGPAARAAFGERGANGVILIATKAGAAGKW